MPMLRLLLDQMIDIDVAAHLSERGYDVLVVSEVGMARADDAEILELAIREDRILVTLDDDFGDWAILPLDRHPGVIRAKVEPTDTENIESVLFPFLEASAERDFSNRLLIVRRGRARWIRTGRTDIER